MGWSTGIKSLAVESNTSQNQLPQVSRCTKDDMLEIIRIGTHVFFIMCILRWPSPRGAFSHWLHLWDLSPTAAAATASQLYRTEDVTGSVSWHIILVHWYIVQLFSCTVHGGCHSRRTTVEVLIVYYYILL